MKQKRFKNYLPLSLILLFILSLVPVFAAESVTVDAYMQHGTEVLFFDDLAVDAGLAAEYGAEYGGNITADDVTAIDVLVAMHKEHYGADFTVDTAKDYMDFSYSAPYTSGITDEAVLEFAKTIGNNASINKMFKLEKGEGENYFNCAYLVNYTMPAADIYVKDWSAYFGYSVNQAVVENGDVVQFTVPYNAVVARFSEDDKLVDEMNVTVGQKVHVMPKSYSVSAVNDNGEKALKETIAPITNATLVNVNDANNTYKIGEDGIAYLSFVEAGQYQYVVKSDKLLTTVLTINATANEEDTVVDNDDVNDDVNDDDRVRPASAPSKSTTVVKADEAVKTEDVKKEDKIEAEVKEKTDAIKVIEFSDVKADDWYFKAVGSCVSKGLIKGYPDGLFKPNAEMTRAMFTTILYRMAGEPTDEAANKYADVSADAWYAVAANWAKKYNISAVLGETFDGDKNITREEMIVMLYAYVDVHTSAYQKADVRILEKFDDGEKVSPENKMAVAWAVENNVIHGNSANTLLPNAFATRAEVAQMLTNFDKDDMAEFSKDVRAAQLQLLLYKNKMLFDKSDKTLDNNNPANASFHVRPLEEKLQVFDKASNKNDAVWDKLRDEVYLRSEGDDTAPLAFDQIDEYTAENYGCSWKNGKLYLKGFAASPYPELSQMLDPKAKDINEQIKAYAEKNNDYIARDNHVIGTWIDMENPDKPVLYLDVSVIYDTAEEARLYCLEKDQIAFYDLNLGEEVRVK